MPPNNSKGKFMKRLIIIGLLVLIATPLLARDKVSTEEMNTYQYLEHAAIVQSVYTQKELNQMISKIDAMSMLIAAYSKVDKEKVDKMIHNNQIAALYQHYLQADMDNGKQIKKALSKRDKRIKKLEQKADNDVFLWLLVALGFLI